MWKNKKKLLFLIAVSSLLSAQSTINSISDHNKLYNVMTEDLTYQKNYEIIEKILTAKNKELKDLYKQSDYIVKPEYLEWQIFFTGFYENTHRGGNSTQKDFHVSYLSEYSLEIPEAKREIISSIQKSLKNASVVYKSSIIVNENTPASINLKSLQSVAFPEINIGNFEPVIINLFTPKIPETVNVEVLASPSVISVGTPQLNKFVVLMPNTIQIQTPEVSDIPEVKKPSTPQVPTVSANEFNPVTFNITPPALASPPVFNIKLGSFCNFMITNCNSKGIDGGPFGGNPISFGSNGTNYNISAGSIGNLGGGALTNGNPAIRYSWGSTASYNSTLLKVYFDYGSVTSNPGGSATLTANLTIDSVNNLTAAQKTTEINNGRSWNAQSFLVGGSRIATLDNVYNASLINNGTMNLVGPLVIGFEVQTDAAYSKNQGKREVINRKTITDAEEAGSAALNTILPVGSSLNLSLPPFAGSGTITVTRDSSGFTGYKIGLMLTYEDADSNSSNSYVFTNEPTGLIDFRGEKSIGIQIYAPGSENVPIKVTNQGVINIGGIESYGLKLSSRANSANMEFSNTGIINVSGNNGTESSRSAGMAVIEDINLAGTKSIRAYTNAVKNSGTINVSGGYGNSGMILKVAAPDNIINSGIININGTSNIGMRVDYGSVNTGSAGSPTAQNNNIINVKDNRNLGIIANGRGSTVNTAVGNNGSTGIVNISGNNSVGLFSTNGGKTINTALGTISVSGTSSLGIVVADSTSAGTNSGIINISGSSSAGVYNVGTFNMDGGSITASSPRSVAIYSKPLSATSITGGTINVNNGAAALSAENSTISMAGPVVTVNSGGLFF